MLHPTKGRIIYEGKDIYAVGDEYQAKIDCFSQDVSFYGDFIGGDYLEYSSVWNR